MAAFGVKLVRSLLVVLAVVLLFAGLLLGCGKSPGERAFKEGVRHLGKGNYTRAKVLLEQSLSERPVSEANAVALNYLGVASTRLGQLDRAIDEFEESRTLDAALVEPSYNLALLMYEGGNEERAIQLLQEAATVNLSDTRALEYLGHIYLANGEWAEARRVLYQALERAPESPSILTAIAWAEYEIDGLDAATAFLMRALEKDPEYPPALFNLGVLYHREEREPEKAISYFRKFLETEPQGPGTEYARRALRELAGSTGEENETPDTRPDQRVEAAPDEPAGGDRASHTTVDELLEQAKAASRRGDVEKTLAYCIRAARRAGELRDRKKQEEALLLAVKLCFDQAKAHYALGAFRMAQGRHDSALASFKRARVLDPQWPAVHAALAEAAMESGEYDAALIALKRAIELEPGNPEPLWTLALLYDEHLDIPQQAAKVYRDFERHFTDDTRIVQARERTRELSERAARKEASSASTAVEMVASEEVSSPPEGTTTAPSPHSVRRLAIRQPAVRHTRAAVEAYNRGKAYQERGDWDRAIFYYTRALENDDSLANAYYNLGMVYSANGETTLAKDAYLHAIQRQPDLINARYNLALLYMELNQYTAAAEQLRTVLELQPRYAPAHYALGLVYARDETNVANAKKHFQQFVRLSPQDPAARTVRRWLRTH